MGFLNTLKEVITNKPSNLKEPHFIKEFNEDNKQLKELTELQKVSSEGQLRQLNRILSCLLME